MRKRILAITLALALCLMRVPAAHASGLPTFDAVNAALQELQNTILNSSFAKDLALSFEKLNELKAQTLEIFRFHSGIDDILDLVRVDPVLDFIDTVRHQIRDVFSNHEIAGTNLEILQAGGTPEILKSSLEAITGAIPEGNARSYIPFEEMQVVEAFELANGIRESGRELRNSARVISDQAKQVSPKGAAKLQAQGISELMILGQQNQEAIAKLLELQATQIEQVSRREKEAESERLRFVSDANEYLESILQPAERISA